MKKVASSNTITNNFSSQIVEMFIMSEQMYLFLKIQAMENGNACIWLKQDIFV